MEPLSLFVTCIFRIYNKDISIASLPNSLQIHVKHLFDPRYLLQVGFKIDEPLYRAIVHYVTHSGDKTIAQNFLASPCLNTEGAMTARAISRIKVIMPFLTYDVVFTEEENYIYYLFLNLVVYHLWHKTRSLEPGVNVNALIFHPRSNPFPVDRCLPPESAACKNLSILLICSKELTFSGGEESDEEGGENHVIRNTRLTDLVR